MHVNGRRQHPQSLAQIPHRGHIHLPQRGRHPPKTFPGGGPQPIRRHLPQHSQSARRRVPRPRDASDEIERHVSLRMARQDVITRSENPMDFWAIVNEAALRRHVGGASVMRKQLLHLVDIAAQPNVTLQVLPYGVGAHAAMLGSFALLSFSEGAGEVAYLEYVTGSLYLEKPEELRAYTLTYDHLRASALDPRASIAMIAKLAEEDF